MNIPLARAALAALALAAAHAAHAQVFYHVDVDSAVLAGHPGAPFSADFQLVDGGANSVHNTATLSNFVLGGGAASGVAFGAGGASGSLATSVVLSDTQAFNEYFQGFIPGSHFAFDLALTTHAESGAPDAFSFAILDRNLANATTGGPGNALLYVSLDPSMTGADVLRFDGTGDYAGLKVTVVPEPAETGAACAAGLVAAALVARRLRRVA